MSPIDKGNRAAAILASEVWQEAWEAYRLRCFEAIEQAKSNDAETVMHIKRLMAAANGAKTHLERIMSDGKVAAHEIKLRESKFKIPTF